MLKNKNQRIQNQNLQNRELEGIIFQNMFKSVLDDEN